VVYNRFVGKGNFQNIFEVWFSDLYGYWRTRLSSYFVTLYWLTGLVLSSVLVTLRGLFFSLDLKDWIKLPNKILVSLV
jgi:hypothetical protein